MVSEGWQWFGETATTVANGTRVDRYLESYNLSWEGGGDYLPVIEALSLEGSGGLVNKVSTGTTFRDLCGAL